MCLQTPDVTTVKELDRSTAPPLSQLVNKLMGCFHHLEQVQLNPAQGISYTPGIYPYMSSRDIVIPQGISIYEFKEHMYAPVQFCWTFLYARNIQTGVLGSSLYLT